MVSSTSKGGGSSARHRQGGVNNKGVWFEVGLDVGHSVIHKHPFKVHTRYVSGSFGGSPGLKNDKKV